MKAIWPPVPAGSEEWQRLQRLTIDPKTGEKRKVVPRTKGGWPLFAVLTPFYLQCLKGGGYTRTLLTDLSSLARFDHHSVKNISEFYA